MKRKRTDTIQYHDEIKAFTQRFETRLNSNFNKTRCIDELIIQTFWEEVQKKPIIIYHHSTSKQIKMNMCPFRKRIVEMTAVSYLQDWQHFLTLTCDNDIYPFSLTLQQSEPSKQEVCIYRGQKSCGMPAFYYSFNRDMVCMALVQAACQDMSDSLLCNQILWDKLRISFKGRIWQPYMLYLYSFWMMCQTIQSKLLLPLELQRMICHYLLPDKLVL